MKPGRLKIDRETFVRLAARIVPFHSTYVALGLDLVSSNRWVHIDCHGLITARFVYRGERDTVTYVAKQMQVQWR